MKYKCILVWILLFMLFPLSAVQRSGPQTEEGKKEEFQIITVAEGLEHPWGMAFLPDGSLLVTERAGRLLHISNGDISEISGLPEIHAGGQGGLLDIALHPEFTDNHLVYMTFSQAGRGGSGTALMRGVFDNGHLRDTEVLYRMPGLTSGGAHFGSRIVFAPDGTIYMSIGDRGSRNRAQDLSDAAGSTIRLNHDGTIPEDNPFAGRSDVLQEIFSYGHRNAQGMAVHPQTGRIWQHEHGPRGGDELNILISGANYGWPEVSYGEEYSGGEIGSGTSAPGMEDPIIHWTPSIAPSGMTFYTGTLFPQWKGSIFAGALAGRHLRRIDLEGDKVIGQEVLLQGEVGRIRDVREGPDGAVWFITDERNGKIYRLVP